MWTSFKSYLVKLQEPAILLTMVGLLAGGFVFTGALEARLASAEDRLDRFAPVIQQSLKDAAQIDDIKNSLHRIDDNVNWIIRQMVLQGTKP